MVGTVGPLGIRKSENFNRSIWKIFMNSTAPEGGEEVKTEDIGKQTIKHLKLMITTIVGSIKNVDKKTIEQWIIFLHLELTINTIGTENNLKEWIINIKESGDTKQEKEIEGLTQIETDNMPMEMTEDIQII